MPAPTVRISRYALRCFTSLAASAAATVTLASTPSLALAERDDALSVMQLAGFVRWPTEFLSGLSFRVCLRDDDPAFASFMSQRGSLAYGKPLTIHALDPSEFNTKPCHLAFFSDGYAETSIIEQLRDRPTLTVSPQRGFALRGGLIELSEKDGRTILIVDRDRVTDHTLGFSAQLLAISHDAGEW